ncbi:MAG: UDP-glucuronosyltransferase [Bacteroidales bacterium]|nr:UDP-glucuronosyltransferase [Bacteroidales bacterium]
MNKNSISILITASSLGGYIPGLIVSRQLEEKGFNTEVFILENLLKKEKKDKILTAKIVYHKNFSAALMGQKIVNGMENTLDDLLIDELIHKWKEEKRKRFIVFSGFWSDIISKYINEVGEEELTVDLCHVDASVSTSWKAHKNDLNSFRHIWFYNLEEKKVSYYLQLNNHEPVLFSERKKRLLLHGGGWGLGTYLTKVGELENAGFSLDVICIEKDDAKNKSKNIRYYLIDPLWKAWEPNENGEYIFPPFGEITDNENVLYKSNYDYPDVYDICRESLAIISKPGGATLIDSLSSATPIITLEPYGNYENSNALLWEQLGFGIPFKKWAESSFSIELLEKMNKNLLQARKNINNYIPEIYATKNIS